MWLEAGSSFDAGDRHPHLFRPPIFDGPTTRGLYDEKTGVMWAVDSFAALTTGAVYEAPDLPPDLYDETFMLFNSMKVALAPVAVAGGLWPPRRQHRGDPSHDRRQRPRPGAAGLVHRRRLRPGARPRRAAHRPGAGAGGARRHARGGGRFADAPMGPISSSGLFRLEPELVAAGEFGVVVESAFELGDAGGPGAERFGGGGEDHAGVES